MAAALKGYLKSVAKHHNISRTNVHMQLIEAAPRVLPMLEPKASAATLKQLKKLGVKVHTNTAVKGETATSLQIGDKIVPTKTVVWTAGVTNNPFFIQNDGQFVLNERKRIVVDGNLRVDDRTFVIGDNAATPYSGLAITALHNASYVAKFIHSNVRSESIARYKPMKPITIIPVGEDWSVFQWRKLVITGRFAAWMRTVYDFVGYAEVMGPRAAASIWLRRNKIREDCHFCQPPQK